MKTFAEQKALVSQLNLMDDLFFHKVAEDTKACEEILRIILKKPNLTVKDCQPQRYLRNVDAHSVVLDVLCTDESGKLFNIEVQKQDDDAHQRRVRFNISNIDTTFIEKGLHYKNFPDVCVVFISKFDMFDLNRTLYHVRRVIDGTENYVENGTHEVYVNAAVNDGSDIAELMQYFINSSGYHETFKAVCNRVNYLKEVNEGVNSMSSVIERYAEEYAKRYHEERVQNVIEEYAKKYHEERMRDNSVIERYAEEYAKKYHEERTNDERRTFAIKLLKDALYPLNKIAELTGLSEQEVERLKLTIV